VNVGIVPWSANGTSIGSDSMWWETLVIVRVQEGLCSVELGSRWTSCLVAWWWSLQRWKWIGGTLTKEEVREAGVVQNTPASLRQARFCAVCRVETSLLCQVSVNHTGEP
jgi:hypothetical protein